MDKYVAIFHEYYIINLIKPFKDKCELSVRLSESSGDFFIFTVDLNQGMKAMALLLTFGS